MKKLGMCLLLVLNIGSANAYYQTFVKKVDWGLSKASAMNSRNTEFKKVIEFEDASTTRFLFSEVKLGQGNYLRIDFPYKKKPLFLNDRIIKGFGNGTPYLRGGKFRLSIVLKNKSRFGGLKIAQIEANRPSNKMKRRTICEGDDRVASDEKKMGRMMRDTKGNGGCSGGMFSKTCLITAGHCLSTTKIVEFQVPESSESGSPNPAEPEDQYAKVEVIDTENEGPGQDWLVARYDANPITGKFPGEAQGFYEVNADELNKGDMVRITGYGIERKEKIKSQTQQTNAGELIKFEPALRYRVDTEPGNSGTPVVDEATNSIIGVHTHGGCGNNSGSNQGTSVHFSERFQAAIKACLEAERKDLRNRR